MLGRVSFAWLFQLWKLGQNLVVGLVRLIRQSGLWVTSAKLV